MKNLCKFFFVRSVWLLFCSCLGASQAYAGRLPEYTATRGDISGKEFSLTLVGATPGETRQLADDVWAEIVRLEKILGREKDGRDEKGREHMNHSEKDRPERYQSELAQLNAHAIAQPQSPELQAVLQLCESWREKTGNAISCRLGSLNALWQQAAQSGELPERSALRKTARRLAALEQPLAEESGRITGLQWELGNLAKGYLLDAALAKARALAPATLGIKLELDGSAIYWGINAGQQAWSVAVDQRLAAENVQRDVNNRDVINHGVLALQSRALAYSDSQVWQIGRRRFSRTLNPADAWPVMFAPSVAVVAADATTAAALAQALTVMPITRGLDLVKSLPKAEVLIMTETGKTFASEGWYSLLIPDELHQPLWERDMQFLVEYQIPALSVAEYRRPYVAVWITDTRKEPVRQLLVHGDRLRWLREIPLWWRRAGRRDESMIDGLARPTPKQGQHMLVWDGRDDSGHRVEKGEYILHIEAAREHGERELVTVPFTLTTQPFSYQEQGAKELGRVKVSFKPVP
jgi:thiamine biosynthesis lipoprotein